MATPASVPVLLTRPEADSLRLAAELPAGTHAIVAPLLRIVFLPFDVARVPAAASLILTSGHGVAAWTASDGGARGAWCVGPRTAEMAARAGLDLRGQAPTADALLDRIPADASPLVHLRGAHHRGAMVDRLRARGLRASALTAYRADACPLTPAALTALRDGPVVAPVFSPRTARLLSAACPIESRGNLRPVALSPAVAQALPVPPAAVAERPDGAAMRAAIQRVIDAILG